jgi:hypothetical protein
MDKKKPTVKLATRPYLGKLRGVAGVDLTAMQRTFIVTLVRQGCTPTQAARQAGYSEPKTSAYDLLKKEHIQAAVRIERGRYVSSDLANVATSTLRTIMLDDQAPASARVQAARTVLELSRDIGRAAATTGDSDRELSEMSAAELAGLIDRWQGERAALATEIDPNEVEILDNAQHRAELAPEIRADT